MDGPNADAKAAMAEDIVRPYYIAFLDIGGGDPIRVTNAPYSLQFPADFTGDDDLDGNTFLALDPDFVSVSEVKRKEGGTETVTCVLSGMIGLDNDLMNQLGNTANFQGREIRLWQMRYDENLQLIGNIWPFHTGYMTVPKVTGDRTSQSIQLDSESYLGFMTSGSNRSYLDQSRYDPLDQSAAASIACANGTTAAGGSVGGVIEDQRDYG